MRWMRRALYKLTICSAINKIIDIVYGIISRFDYNQFSSSVTTPMFSYGLNLLSVVTPSPLEKARQNALKG